MAANDSINNQTTTGADLTVIGPDTKIKGEMFFESGARILGQFEGKIASGASIEIAQSAICEAEIEAERICVDGRVTGNVHARDQLELSVNAVVQGDISAGTLTVAEGATFVGHCSVGPAADTIESQPGSSVTPVANPAANQAAATARAVSATARSEPKSTPAPVASGVSTVEDNDAAETTEFRAPWRTDKDAADSNGESIARSA